MLVILPLPTALMDLIHLFNGHVLTACENIILSQRLGKTPQTVNSHYH